MSIEDIRDLVNNNKWDKIYSIIKKLKNKDILSEDIGNGNNILHLSILNNKKKIFEYILQNYPDIIMKVNDNGENILHIIAYYTTGIDIFNPILL